MLVKICSKLTGKVKKKKPLTGVAFVCSLTTLNKRLLTHFIQSFFILQKLMTPHNTLTTIEEPHNEDSIS